VKCSLISPRPRIPSCLSGGELWCREAFGIKLFRHQARQRDLIVRSAPRQSGARWGHTAGRYISGRTHLVSMGLECLPGLQERLQAGKNTGPSIGAGSVGGVILGPLVMRHCYFGGFGLRHEFDRCA
jgi:hypothetical protein